MIKINSLRLNQYFTMIYDQYNYLNENNIRSISTEDD